MKPKYLGDNNHIMVWGTPNIQVAKTKDAMPTFNILAISSIFGIESINGLCLNDIRDLIQSIEATYMGHKARWYKVNLCETKLNDGHYTVKYYSAPPQILTYTSKGLKILHRTLNMALKGVGCKCL